MSLMYTSTDNVISRNSLHQLPMPAAQGRFHRPLPFGDFADQVISSLSMAGLSIDAEEYAVSKDQQRLFGLVEVSPVSGEYIARDDWNLQIGLRGSHDQSISRGISIGSRVLVCSNLCFHGDLGTLSTKQTINAPGRISALIDNALQKLPEVANRNGERFDRYRMMPLRPRHGDAALVELHRRHALTSAQLSRAITEWDTPSHEEHAEDGHTVWRLFNAATEALKPTGAQVNMDLIRQRSQTVSGFLDEVVGI